MLPAAGGTGSSGVPSNGQLLIGNSSGTYTPATLTAGANISISNGNGSITIAASGGSSGVTTFSAGTTGLTPNTPQSGSVTLGGFLSIANGGTGQQSAQAALNALLPTQSSGTNNQVLTSNGTNAVWVTPTSGGTVTSVNGASNVSGLTLTGGPITSTGTLTLNGTLLAANGGTGLTSVGSSGQVLGSTGSSYTWLTVPQLSGTNSWTNTNTFSGTFSVTTPSGFASFTPTIQANNGLISTNGYLFINGSTPTLNFQNAGGTASYGQVLSGPTQTALVFGSNAFSIQSGGSFISTNLTVSNGEIVINASGGGGLLAFGPGGATASVYTAPGGLIQLGVLSGNITQCTAAANSGTTSTGPYNNVSDARIKENVTELTSALSLISQLKGVYFNYIDSPSLGRQIGLIAQDVINVVPEVVTKTEIPLPASYNETDTQYAVAYASLVPVLINAIKELEERVASLEAKSNS